jgi:hypothetical protein
MQELPDKRLATQGAFSLISYPRVQIAEILEGVWTSQGVVRGLTDTLMATMNRRRRTRHGHNVREKPNFHYEPLDRSQRCMRLLEVLHEDDGQTIRCKLRTYAIESVPRYVALSYTWDRDDSSAYIECNGMRLRVGKNVSDVLALYGFRAKDETKVD